MKQENLKGGETEDGRLRRAEPTRRQPLRNLGGAYVDEPIRSKSGRGSRKRVSPTEDVVVRAVQLGYRIADDQMQRGQDWARRLRPGSGGPGLDVGDAVDRGFGLWREMAVLMVEMAESALAGPATLRMILQKMLDATGPTAPAAPSPAARAAGTVPSAPTTVTSGDHRPRASAAASCHVEISSAQPVRVKVDLRGELTDDVVVYPLYLENDPHAPPIAGSVKATEKGHKIVQATVPRDQKPGSYRGAIMRPSEREPLGFVELEVLSS